MHIRLLFLALLFLSAASPAVKFEIVDKISLGEPNGDELLTEHQYQLFFEHNGKLYVLIDGVPKLFIVDVSLNWHPVTSIDLELRPWRSLTHQGQIYILECGGDIAVIDTKDGKLLKKCQSFMLYAHLKVTKKGKVHIVSVSSNFSHLVNSAIAPNGIVLSCCEETVIELTPNISICNFSSDLFSPLNSCMPYLYLNSHLYTLDTDSGIIYILNARTGQTEAFLNLPKGHKATQLLAHKDRAFFIHHLGFFYALTSGSHFLSSMSPDGELLQTVQIPSGSRLGSSHENQLILLHPNLNQLNIVNTDRMQIEQTILIEGSPSRSLAFGDRVFVLSPATRTITVLRAPQTLFGQAPTNTTRFEDVTVVAPGVSETSMSVFGSNS